MKKKKNKKILLILIGVMLILIALSTIWIIHRGHQIQEAREKEAAELAAQEEARKQAEEEAAAKEAAKEEDIASHVYSHRGSEGPEEHSFKAYDAAIEAGSHYIELDLVISSDGVLYVSHDLNALNMTGYNGMYEYISSGTIDEFRTEAGNPVLRLTDVFDKYGKDINYVIELKPDSEACADAFGDVVDDYGLSEVITVQSMYPEILEKLEERYPDMPKLDVCWNQADFEYGVDKPYVDILSVKAAAGLMTESNCSLAHENGKLFSAWTLDTEDEIKAAIDMGVDNYFTNDTPLALSIERDYGASRRGGQ